MPRRGENIYKRKDGRWEGRYIKGRSHGKAQYGYVFARSYSEVKAKLSAARSETSLKPESSTSDSADVSSVECFAQIANEWLIVYRSQWKQASVVKYTNILNLYLIPNFADLSVSKITREHIIEFSNKLLLEGGQSGKPLSPKTVNNILSVMKNVLEFASRVKGFNVMDTSDISVKQMQKPMRVFSKAEQYRLNRYLYSNMNRKNLGILVCLYTGLRIGEICALKWGDISFSEQYICVRQCCGQFTHDAFLLQQVVKNKKAGAKSSQPWENGTRFSV